MKPTDSASDPLGDTIQIGISSCLLGEKVRFDGGHKHDPFLTGTLARFVTFVPVCPEVGIGLGSPRESMRLLRGAEGLRLVAPASGVDHTATMRRYAREKVRELAGLGLCGYVLKKDSPTCGMERVKTYDKNGVPVKDGVGLFAEALLASDELLPIEEEGRLHDPRLRENFFERVFAYRRVRGLFAGRWKLGELVEFHAREKFLVLAHHPKSYQELGRLVAEGKPLERSDLAQRYARGFLVGLRHLATNGRNANVLQHLLGYFKDKITPAEKQEAVEVVDDYRNGLVPLIVPITLLRHYVRIHGSAYLEHQTYLAPHPKELMLRNHV